MSPSACGGPPAKRVKVEDDGSAAAVPSPAVKLENDGTVAVAATAGLERSPPPPSPSPGGGGGAVVILIHGGKQGFLAGESPKGYVNAQTGQLSATGQLKDVINPRARLNASCPGSFVIGPCTKIDGNPLNVSPAGRASLKSVTAYNHFLAANVMKDTPTILFGCCAGIENSLEAIAGRYQDFKTRESLSYTVIEGGESKDSRSKAKEKGAAAAAFKAAEHARASVAGHIFYTPIAWAGDQVQSDLRIAPFLALPQGTRVLIITGDKDAPMLAAIRGMISRMKCSATTQLHVVAGAGHNPFDSTPRKAGPMTVKNTAAEAVIRTFVNGCCQAFALAHASAK